jgi:hypothetical protein
MYASPIVRLMFFVLALQIVACADSIATAETRQATIDRELKSYRKVAYGSDSTIGVEDSSTAYYKGKHLRKTVSHLRFDSGQTVSICYFWQGRLFLYSQTDDVFSAATGTPRWGNSRSQTETRAYFENGKMVRLLVGKVPQSLTTNAAKKRQEQILNGTRFDLRMAQSVKSR